MFRNCMICLVFSLFLVLGGGADCRAEIKVLAVKHLVAEEILPVIRDVLEGQGRVSVWDNRLILHASADEIATIEEVLAQLDVPPTMLRISVKFKESKAQAGTRAVLSSADILPGPVSGAQLLANTEEQTTHMLRIRDGGRGFIMMGEMVPYVQEMLLLARRYASYGQTVEFQAVNTGFWVRPILERGFATLEIRPHMEGFQRSSRRMMGLPMPVRFEEMVSTVRVPIGQWVDLGHQLKEGDEVSRAILTWRTSNLRQQRSLWVKVDI